MDILKRLSSWTDGMSNADVYKLAHDEIALLRAQLSSPQPTSQDAERLKYLHAYYCFKGQLVDTPYDDWIANIDAIKQGKT